VSGCGRDRSKDIFLSADKDTAEKWWISAVRFGATQGGVSVKASIASGCPPASLKRAGGRRGLLARGEPRTPFIGVRKMNAEQRSAERSVAKRDGT